MSESRSLRSLEEDCSECGHLMSDHIHEGGRLICPEFIVDLDMLRIDAERAAERYQEALKRHEPR